MQSPDLGDLRNKFNIQVLLGILSEEQSARNNFGGFFHSKTEKLMYLKQHNPPLCS